VSGAAVIAMRTAPITAIIISALACAGCSATKMAPVYCIVVAARDAQGPELLSVFDRFAEAQGLSAPRTPVTRVYISADRRIELDVATYMGPVGSTVAYFDLQGEAQSPFLEDLQRFPRRGGAALGRARLQRRGGISGTGKVEPGLRDAATLGCVEPTYWRGRTGEDEPWAPDDTGPWMPENTQRYFLRRSSAQGDTQIYKSSHPGRVVSPLLGRRSQSREWSVVWRRSHHL
jgi:hypothetical protein